MIGPADGREANQINAAKITATSNQTAAIALDPNIITLKIKIAA